MLIDQIYIQARETPDKPALIVDGQAIFYRAFAAVIDRSRSYLAAQGLPADAVAVLPTGSNATVWILLLALRSLGLTTIVVPSANSIGALGLPEARCVVAVSGEHPSGLDRVCAAAGLTFIDVPTEIYAGVADAAVPDLPDHAVLFGGHVLLTSGTTGAYKKVGLDPSHQPSQMAYRREIFGINQQSVVNIFNLGCWTAGGHNFAMAAWDAGGAVVIYQQPDLWRSLRTPGITHCFVFPQLLSGILRAPEGELARNDEMRLISTGGPLSQALTEAAKARLTSRIYNYLGATEAGGYTFTPIEGAEDLRWHRVISSRRVEVVDEESRVMPVGQTGFVRVDLAGGVTGYLHDEAATRAFFRDGFFYPGDLGMFRADGRLALQGRVTDVINILGQKIASAPIEQALERELGVSGVCVFSAQSETLEEEVQVAIETEQAIDETRLAPVLRRLLPGAPAFRVSFFRALPRNHMGKVQRIELRRLMAPPPAASGRAANRSPSSPCDDV